jgi:hypothetical protein
LLCTEATAHFVDNSNQGFTDGLWAAADIFISLADNFRETFGLVPVEAMAYRYIADIDTYGHFIGGAAQTTAVDDDDLTSALANLAANADLRRQRSCRTSSTRSHRDQG